MRCLIEEEDLPPTLPYSQSNESPMAMFILDEYVIVGEEVIAVANVSDEEDVSLLRVYKYHGDEHEHNTRHNTHPRCPIVNTEIMHRSFLYLGPNLWMSLNDHIQSSRTKTTFKRRITQNYIKEY